MAGKKKNVLKNQVAALEALAGLTPLDEKQARKVNGGATVNPGGPIKPLRGTGAVAVRRGTGAIAVRFGTGAIAVRGTGAIAVRRGGGH
jgi:hypothetical protein